MKSQNILFQVIDWEKIPKTEHKGGKELLIAKQYNLKDFD